MTPLSYLSDEFDFDTFETHLLIDQMEKEEQANIEDGESVLSSTPIRYSQNDNKEYKTEVDLNDVSEVIEEDTVEDVSTCNSPSADLPTILITPEADPIEPDEIRVPILGYDVMESRSKFTNIFNSKKQRKQISLAPDLRGKGTTVDSKYINVPIVGYEIMDKRERTIVYKIEVERSGFDRWFVFRRYNDFYQLHDKLKKLFPNFRLALPSRRWFRDNYDKDFLEDRTLGLQAFLNNITGHKDICNSKDVRDFFCFDDPPGPHDSLEESRALCDNLEETIYVLRKELSEKDEEIDILHEELSLYKNQVEILTRELREKNKDAVVAMSPVSNQLSLAECDQETGAESDQSANSCHSDGHLTMIKSDSEERKQEGKKTRNAWTKKDSNPIVEVDLYHS